MSAVEYVPVYKKCQKCNSVGHQSVTCDTCPSCYRGWVFDRYAPIEDSRVRAIVRKTFHFWLNPKSEVVAFSDSESQDVLPDGGAGWKFIETKQIELGMPL